MKNVQTETEKCRHQNNFKLANFKIGKSNRITSDRGYNYFRTYYIFKFSTMKLDKDMFALHIISTLTPVLEKSLHHS